MSFDPNEWCDAVGVLGPDDDGYWMAPRIVGPRDACYALRIREMARPLFDFGAPVPTDVFILSTGKGPSRACSKVGGLPLRCRQRRWPTCPAGHPLPFLAQFDFRGSADLLDGLPGEILLLFGRSDLKDGLVMEWVNDSDTPDLVSAADVPVQPTVPALHGARWRTVNFPAADPPDDFWSQTDLEDGACVTDLAFALTLFGMQIGPSPYLPAWDRVAKEDERILCSLGSIAATRNEPYPFLNHGGPLTDSRLRQFDAIFSTIDPDENGFGVLYVLLNSRGELRWQHTDL